MVRSWWIHSGSIALKAMNRRGIVIHWLKIYSSRR